MDQETHEFVASGLAEYVTLNCLEHGMWTGVAIKRIHDDGSAASLFSSEKVGGLRASAFKQAEVLQFHDMLMKVYLAWV